MQTTADLARQRERRGSRVPALDAVRGLAVIGMLVVNVGPVASDDLLYDLYMLPAGRASMLFVVVAGIGMSIALRRGTPSRIVLWRAAVLLLLGLALLPLPHDVNIILPLYGAVFVSALLLHRLSTPVLIAVAALLGTAGPAVILSERLSGAATLREFGVDEGPLHALLLGGPYPLAVWIVPFIVGLIVGRLDLSDRALLVRMLSWSIAATVFPLAVDALAGERQEGWGLLLTAAAHGQMPLWIASAIGSALAITAATLLLAHRVARLLTPLALLGRMSLTMYVLHVLLLTLIRPFGELDAAAATVVSAAILLAMYASATLLQRVDAVGPFERLTRARWLRTPAMA
jgi:uncharacterized membrane protein YeiB